jgi:dsDNA-specific endonuclease/ATPase MutS2
MSKLGDHLTAVKSTERVANEFTYVRTTTVYEPVRELNSTVYEITTTLKNRVIVSDYTSQRGSALVRATRDARAAILEEIFGEFRKSLILARSGVHERKWEVVLAHIDKVMESMYDY